MAPEPPDHLLYRPHPWHGITPRTDEPSVVQAFIEITRLDTIKYEIDVTTGYLSVDRPQRSTSLPPVPYGFIPRTLCGRRAAEAVGRHEEGDGDALDICVLSEHDIERPEVILQARIIGVIDTLDEGQADPKLIGVLVGDQLWGKIRELEDVPEWKLQRLEDYFRHYKVEPPNANPVKLVARGDRKTALAVLDAAEADYRERFADQIPVHPVARSRPSS